MNEKQVRVRHHRVWSEMLTIEVQVDCMVKGACCEVPSTSASGCHMTSSLRILHKHTNVYDAYSIA